MEMPVLDAANLTRLGFTEQTRGEICWVKQIPQGWVWVNAETGIGRLKTEKEGVIIPLKFGTVTQIKWFLNCLK